MRRSSRISLLLLTILSSTFSAPSQASYYIPRASIWGLAGSETQGRLDTLLPLSGNANNLFYTDLQGGVGKDDAWYGGLGAGYRQLVNNAGIYGGYVFVDRNESENHNQYWVVSPGVEAIFPLWDLRLNGYFPVNKRSHETQYFPSQRGDCRFVEFKAHDQFEHQFSSFENVGPGTDAEVGYTFVRLHNTTLHGGVYYFNINNSHSSINNIRGVEARLEVPVNPYWAVDVESSYDNYQHSTVVAGLRFNLGSMAPNTSDLHTHMVDPITRNLGSLHSGSGIPIVESQRENGLLLQRSNIYFFSSEGGSAFVDPRQSGTFENPLSKDQFSQAVVNQIGTNANLYFNPGTYPIVGVNTPNAHIDMPLGDSIYGRGAANFKCPATGDARPLLLGRLNLFTSDHTIDSIRLLNSKTDTTGVGSEVIAMSLQDAQNVVLSNDDIKAEAVETGILSKNNFATGIDANNSQVTILGSTISATASVVGVNNNVNFAAGIGENYIGNGSANFNKNNFALIHSHVSATASVTGINNNVNFAAGIGANNIGNGAVYFKDNKFLLTNSSINSATPVIGINNNVNFAAGIGGNSIGIGTIDFNSNDFNLIKSSVSGVASVTGINNNANFSAGIGENYIGNDPANFNNNNFALIHSNVSATAVTAINNNVNFAVAIGANNIGNGAVYFKDNKFLLTNSSIKSAAPVIGINNNVNFSAGIGANNIGNGADDFNSNHFILIKSNVSGVASVTGVNNNANFSAGIGGNNIGFGSTDFKGNDFTLIKSNVNGVAILVGNNAVENSSPPANMATGIGGNNAGGTANFNGNKFALLNSHVGGIASVIGNNKGFNFTAAIGGNEFPGTGGSANFTNNTINISGGDLNAIAVVAGDNSGTNQSLGINTNAGDNTVNADHIIINVLARVIGDNTTGINKAVGLNAGLGSDTINIASSMVNIIAQVNPAHPGTNSAMKITGAGTINHPNTEFNVVIIP